jgi:DNA-binding XRE family transcriptional regulator
MSNSCAPCQNVNNAREQPVWLLQFVKFGYGVDMISLPPSFDGMQLRALRREAGLTQQQLADELCMSRETIVAIENNRPSAIEGLRLKTIQRWCCACRPYVRYQTLETFTKYLLNLILGNA